MSAMVMHHQFLNNADHNWYAQCLPMYITDAGGAPCSARYGHTGTVGFDPFSRPQQRLIRYNCLLMWVQSVLRNVCGYIMALRTLSNDGTAFTRWCGIVTVMLFGRSSTLRMTRHSFVSVMGKVHVHEQGFHPRDASVAGLLSSPTRFISNSNVVMSC